MDAISERGARSSAAARTAPAAPARPAPPRARRAGQPGDAARLRRRRRRAAHRPHRRRRARLRALAQSNPELGGPHANLGLISRQAGKLPEAVGRARDRPSSSARASRLPEPARRHLSPAGRVRQGARRLRAARSPSTRTTPRRRSTSASSTTCTWATAPRALELYTPLPRARRRAATRRSPNGSPTSRTASPAPITVSRKEKP